MQSTTRWCLNEGSSRVVRTIEWRVLPDRPSRFTGHFSVSVAKRREWDSKAVIWAMLPVCNEIRLKRL